MKKNETGRSMVEMLGVLAIVGVLSAGALKGYSAAMFKYKMNQTIDAFNSFLQRFMELEEKNLGPNFFEIIGADDMLQYGLIDQCIKETDSYGRTGCRLPIGLLSSYCEGNQKYIRCSFSMDFTDSKSCIAFASAGWENAAPVEWWTYPDDTGSGGYIYILTENDSYYIYNPNNTGYDIITQTTMQSITEACSHCNEEGGCSYMLVVRSEP